MRSMIPVELAADLNLHDCGLNSAVTSTNLYVWGNPDAPEDVYVNAKDVEEAKRIVRCWFPARLHHLVDGVPMVLLNDRGEWIDDPNRIGWFGDPIIECAAPDIQLAYDFIRAQCEEMRRR